ncbi:MAG: hypothetical protein ACYCWW_09690 [Deltaproteobacteria bacterium]
MRSAFKAPLFAVLLASCAAGGGADAGPPCIDAGPNDVCGAPAPFSVRFTGWSFPRQLDGGPDPTLMEVVLANRDLSSACGGSPKDLPAFTAVFLRLDGQGGAIDAGVYTAPAAQLSELDYSPDGGPTLLGGAAAATIDLSSWDDTTAVGTFDGTLAVEPTGLGHLWGSFVAKGCPGLHQALGE